MNTSDLTVIGTGAGMVAALAFAAQESVDIRSADTMTDVVAEVRKASGPVLLSLTEDVPFRELAELLRVAHEENVPCGFVDSWRGTRAAVAHAEGIRTWQPSREPGITFWNSLSTTTGRAGSYSAVDIIAHDVPSPGESLAAARRTMAMITHGNGADAPFGDGLLCGRLTFAPDLVLTSYLPCGQGGGCVRATSVDGEIRQPKRTSMQDLGGDVVLWGTCYGLLTADSVFDPRGGLLAGLLGRPSGVPHVITAVRSTEVDDLEVLAACARIEAGEPLGSVVTCLNEAYLADAPDGTLPPWILFGDPRARVARDHSVQVSSEGTAISAGLHLHQRSEETAGGPIAVFEQDRPTTRDDLWIRPLAKRSEALLLRRAPGPTVRVTDVPVDPRALVLFEREIAAVEQLTFSDMFFRLAQAHPANGGFSYQQATAERVAGTLQYLSNLQFAPRHLIDLSGDHTALRDRLSAELDNWRRVNDELLDALGQVLRTIGGVIHHLYAYVPLAPAASAVRSCPLCGSQAELSVYRLPHRVSSRATLRCGRCTIVSDVDEKYDSLLLCGPEEVTIGRTARFTLRCATTPGQGVQYARARLFAQPNPYLPDDRWSEATVEDSRSDLSFELTWTPPPGIQPGRHFLLAPAVVDGSVLVGRRSVLVLPPAEPTGG
jgi:hypothetical protein